MQDRIKFNKTPLPLSLVVLLLNTVVVHAAQGQPLFPTDLPAKQWVTFSAAGYSRPVCGVIHRLKTPAVCGMPLGGVDTGCIDLETSGLWGYCTIFNSHVPRRGPLNLPFLGLSVGADTWVLCDPKQTKQGRGEFQKPLEPPLNQLHLDGLKLPDEIHYWGHYPVVDMAYELDAPVGVSLRAWASFFPGDVASSMIPGSVFEVHLQNQTEQKQTGTLAYSFPGPSAAEAGAKTFTRKQLLRGYTGVHIQSPKASYLLGVIGDTKVRLGAALGSDGKAWAAIAQTLPQPTSESAGASAAVDFTLAAGEEKTVRFLLTWHSPQWKGGGHPAAETGNVLTHMYALHYSDAVAAADLLAKKHAPLLACILAWQQVVYADQDLPDWLKDALINVLHLITEDGMWATAQNPLPKWVKPEDGLFGMNESPRGCPQIECIPCSFYGNMPLVYFFPELALSSLRGYKGYQMPDGDMPWIFGGVAGRIDLTEPCCRPQRGANPQVTLNGLCYAAMVDRYLQCRGDDTLLQEFYPSVKKNTRFTMNLASEELAPGDRVISMPAEQWKWPGHSVHWFEATDPGWFGVVPHVGGLHLAQCRIAERIALKAGDQAFASQCSQWIAAGSESLESKYWLGDYYVYCLDAQAGKRSDLIFAYQLDGQWVTDFHGLAGVFRKDRIDKTLDTLKRCNVALSKSGAINYARSDGTPYVHDWYGTYSYFPPEALMLAMTYIYQGQRELGLDLARRCWENMVCKWGYMWDMPNIIRGDQDTGERAFGHDYYQDMMLWALPAALAGQDMTEPCKPAGLVSRIITAAGTDIDTQMLVHFR